MSAGAPEWRYGPARRLAPARMRSLSERARAGDGRARAELIEGLYGLAYALGLAWRLPAGLEREDLLQEAMVGLVAAVDRWDPDRGALATYATAIIQRRLLRACARQAAVLRGPASIVSLDGPEGEPAREVPDPGPAVEDQVLRSLAVERAWAKLTPAQRQVLEQRAAGESWSAIARGRGVSPQRVWAIQQAARARVGEEE